MFSRPMKTRVTPAATALSMKPGMRWQPVSTWTKISRRTFSSFLSSIIRSKKASQFLLRARSSSVMKNLRMPWAQLARMIFSRSSAVRKRLLRPWTLMMVQNEHWNGQPRPRSKLENSLRVPFRVSTGRKGGGAPSSDGRSAMWS